MGKGIPIFRKSGTKQIFCGGCDVTNVIGLFTGRVIKKSKMDISLFLFYACANVSISNLKFPPTGYKMGQVQPRFLYSFTFVFASTGVPDAVIRSTRSSGTRCLALLICSLVAGHPSVD